jgi:hypothetical protein
MDHAELSFEQILKEAALPPPGPQHYAARRALWLKEPSNSLPPREQPPSTSMSRRKLENLLNTPGALYNDQVWEGGIQKVWKGLSNGASLKRRLPMSLVVSNLFSRQTFQRYYYCFSDQHHSLCMGERRDVASWRSSPRAR